VGVVGDDDEGRDNQQVAIPVKMTKTKKEGRL
jgi:hypothetical protein